MVKLHQDFHSTPLPALHYYKVGVLIPNCYKLKGKQKSQKYGNAHRNAEGKNNIAILEDQEE